MYKSCAEMRVKVRILIAEDEKPLADALTEILKQNRYHVDAVYHGTMAWSMRVPEFMT